MQICIFDLDGTLWEVNSHIDILNRHFGTHIFDSYFAKIFRKFFPVIFQIVIDSLYDKYIGEEEVKDYAPTFRKSAMEIMSHEIELGNSVVIASNAPKEIVESAAKRLGVNSYRFPIGKKHEIIGLLNNKYDHIKVVTDNISDISLLQYADEYVIYVNDKTKRIFERKGFDRKYFMEKNKV
jgi:phosphoserine phosphatase